MKYLLLPLLGALFFQAAATNDFTGHWLVSFAADGTTREISLYLKSDHDLLTGYMSSNHGNEAIHDGKINGQSFSFAIIRDNFGDEQAFSYIGTVQDDTLVLKPSNGHGRVLTLKRVSTEPPGPMPPSPAKISLPPAKPVPYNGLAKTPPMGWNSWNKFPNKVSDQLVRETADAMVRNGMKDAGYIYVNIDDTWEDSRDAQGNIQTNYKFPDMKALAAYVHTKGLKIGIYSSPGPKTCGGYEGSFQHEEQDARTYAAWGFDYLKYDWCSATQVYDYHSMPGCLRKMGEALLSSGRPILFSLCQYGVLHGAQWGASVGGNSWRTTGDISDNWQSMSHIGFDLQLGLDPVRRPRPLERSRHARSRQRRHDPDRIHYALQFVESLAAPLLAGNDLRTCPRRSGILTNKEVIAIDQDPLGKEATRVSKDGNLEVCAPAARRRLACRRALQPRRSPRNRHRALVRHRRNRRYGNS